MDALMAALVSQLVLPLVLFLAASAGAWLITRLPGPLRAWLESGTHQRDLELLLGGFARFAFARSAMGARGPNLAGAVQYVQEHFPETVAKLRPSPEALETMAAAAYERAYTAAMAAKAPGGAL